MFLDKTVTEHTLQIKNRKNCMKKTQKPKTTNFDTIERPTDSMCTYPFINLEVTTMNGDCFLLIFLE